eukprot:Tbor_TRINITY_DN2945_c0_g1::TRINITY_DN2945_c0_g1_i2::g.1166::m.1166/K00621/GNPNAT1, GNA1; glucosamine-phosphate N-acetyltransferase
MDEITTRELQETDNIGQFLELLSVLTIVSDLTTEQFKSIISERKKQGIITLIALAPKSNDVEDNGKNEHVIVGTMSLVCERKFIRGGATVGHIEDVVVCPAFQGKGIASKMYNRLEAVARERGCYKLILDCVDDKVGFYQKLGFERKEIQMRKNL